MSYEQKLEGCFFKDEGHAAFHTFIDSNALDTFREAYKKGQLAPLSWVERTDDISSYQHVLSSFRDFEDILILGTGGSSLGGKTLCALANQKSPRLHFIDNIDPFTFEALFQTIDLKKTGVLGISKSGSTVETLMQLLICLQRFGVDESKSHFLIVTEPKDSPLRNLAEKHDWACLDHPTNVGGRFSCFSVVGVVPGLLAGLDVESFREGARLVLQKHLTEPTPPALEGAAMGYFLERYHQKTLSVLFPYGDQLNSFSLWYRQLWAESLGKEGKGTTPIHSLGTVDQHSQLQLYLGGPKDKFFTIVTCPWEKQGDLIHLTYVSEFKGKTMGDLFAAEQKATYDTLVRHKCPTRLITLERLDEFHLGALMMHFMIETILTSYLLGVNAFDQPAVEEGKKLAREYLAL